MTTDTDSTSSSERLTALERLRDRTDELELIISSLTIFALFSLPGWLFGTFSGIYTHLSDELLIAGTLGITLVAGVSYALAVCFIVHLMARAYWVGLIGLRTVFPEGINWGRTPGIGPITKENFKARLPDLDTAIGRADRLASSLFAVISLITLSILWVGVIMLVVFVFAVQIGAHYGGTNAAIVMTSIVFVVLVGGSQLLLWLLDAQLATRFPQLQNNRAFVGTVHVLGRVIGIFYPQRLILPVQLTLQSNTRPVIFYLALMLGIVAIVLVGNARFAAWQTFSLSGEFTFFAGSTADTGFRSTHYEDMRSPKDKLRAWPRISSFTQKSSYVTVFLPYQPLRDNIMLELECPDPEDTAARIDCLRNLWSVSINDQPIAMAGFETAERTDLSMRGLIGIVPLTGLAPGQHTINVVWNPNADSDEAPVDDRYLSNNRLYRIPFVFAPDYERSLDVSD